MSYSALFKAKARAVLQNHWQTALLIALIVNLPTLLVQAIGTFTHNDLTLRVQTLMLQAAQNVIPAESLPQRILDTLSESGVLIMTILSVLAWLVTPALSLGMNHWTLDRIRGLEEPVSTVFSRLRILLKGIGLRLWIVLKVLLRMLPGMAVCAVSILLLAGSEPAGTDALLSSARLSLTLTYFGVMLMVILGFLGYLQLAMADFILADEPEERVLSAARRSKELMAGRRSALLSLMLSFLLWYLLLSFLASLGDGIGSGVLGLMIQMLGSLFISVYMLAAQGVFYEALREASKQAPISGAPSPTPNP